MRTMGCTVDRIFGKEWSAEALIGATAKTAAAFGLFTFRLAHGKEALVLFLRRGAF
jgi:hypothetical protein